jgi:hypothetical protein
MFKWCLFSDVEFDRICQVDYMTASIATGAPPRPITRRFYINRPGSVFSELSIRRRVRGSLHQSECIQLWIRAQSDGGCCGSGSATNSILSSLVLMRTKTSCLLVFSAWAIAL